MEGGAWPWNLYQSMATSYAMMHTCSAFMSSSIFVQTYFSDIHCTPHIYEFLLCLGLITSCIYVFQKEND